VSSLGPSETELPALNHSRLRTSRIEFEEVLEIPLVVVFDPHRHAGAAGAEPFEQAAMLCGSSLSARGAETFFLLRFPRLSGSHVIPVGGLLARRRRFRRVRELWHFEWQQRRAQLVIWRGAGVQR